MLLGFQCIFVRESCKNGTRLIFGKYDFFDFWRFRKIWHVLWHLWGYLNFWWPRRDSLRHGITFAESFVANGRMATSFKIFFYCPRGELGISTINKLSRFFYPGGCSRTQGSWRRNQVRSWSYYKENLSWIHEGKKIQVFFSWIGSPWGRLEQL